MNAVVLATDVRADLGSHAKGRGNNRPVSGEAGCVASLGKGVVLGWGFGTRWGEAKPVCLDVVAGIQSAGFEAKFRS